MCAAAEAPVVPALLADKRSAIVGRKAACAMGRATPTRASNGAEQPWSGGLEQLQQESRGTQTDQHQIGHHVRKLNNTRNTSNMSRRAIRSGSGLDSALQNHFPDAKAEQAEGAKPAAMPGIPSASNGPSKWTNSPASWRRTLIGREGPPPVRRIVPDRRVPPTGLRNSSTREITMRGACAGVVLRAVRSIRSRMVCRRRTRRSSICRNRQK